ncbi:MAG: toll/interleukin-1 receptor domain-containing protein [Pacificimonas sp.]
MMSVPHSKGVNAEVTPPCGGEEWRYRAFISYAHKDKLWAGWLHRKLETYRVPKGAATPLAGTRALRPVFRDRDELTASSALGDALMAALETSAHLLVICSPFSAKSKWVNEEIRSYKRLHGASRILPIIVSGEPGSGDEDDCIPPALLEPERDGGPPIEPICADARKHADGRQLAFQKLAAGMLSVGLDDLVQRDQARRQRRLAWVTSASILVTIGTSGLAIYASAQRNEAVAQRNVAEAKERQAERTVDFLVDTFAVANPSTENARTITAFTILERGAAKMSDELESEPEVHARLGRALGDIYRNLGLYEKSRMLLDRIVKAPGISEPDLSLLNLEVALTEWHEGDYATSLNRVRRTKSQMKSDWPNYGHIDAWSDELIALNARALADYDLAIYHYKLAEKKYLNTLPPSRPEAAVVHWNLGLTLTTSGRLREAERYLQKAISFYETPGIRDDLNKAIALNNLALNYFSQEDFVASTKRSEMAINTFRRILDPTHPTIATATMLLGRSQDAQGDHVSALKSFGDAEVIFNQAYPDGHAERGFVHVHKALSMMKLGRFPEALKEIHAAKTQYDVSYGKLHANHGDLEVHRAIVLEAAGRIGEARVACAEGADILDRTVGAESPVKRSVMALCPFEDMRT